MNATETPRQFLTTLFQRAVDTADPMRVVAQQLPPTPAGRLLVVGGGKASARMAEAVEAEVESATGLVITRYGYGRPCSGIEIVEAAHPVPDRAGEIATRRLLESVAGLGPDDLVLALISGGGSALLCAPRSGLTLDDKMDVHRQLLASGAPIGEMNIVRKHLSCIKGGQLAAACYPARVRSLLISDVPGDDPADIASGPTVGERSTPEDALEILRRHDIDLPDHVRHVLAVGSSVVSPDDQRLSTTETRIVAAPSQSLDAAADMARQAGLSVHFLGDSLEGEAREVGAFQARLALSMKADVDTSGKPALILSGGECTVTRRGDGIGGPNAEFVLAAALTLNGHAGIHILAGDTDGVDGAAEVAGAYADRYTLETARHLKIDPRRSLENNDAHTFFAAVGGQLVTGPTLTNVNDFRALMILPASGH